MRPVEVALQGTVRAVVPITAEHLGRAAAPSVSGTDSPGFGSVITTSGQSRIGAHLTLVSSGPVRPRLVISRGGKPSTIKVSKERTSGDVTRARRTGVVFTGLFRGPKVGHSVTNVTVIVLKGTDFPVVRVWVVVLFGVLVL